MRKRDARSFCFDDSSDNADRDGRRGNWSVVDLCAPPSFENSFNDPEVDEAKGACKRAYTKVIGETSSITIQDLMPK